MLHVLVLAAGLGTRMKSEVVKVLHPVAGRPLVFWPVELARTLGADRVVAVLGHQLEAVRAALDARFGPGAIAVAEQKQPRGTGDAVRSALPALEGGADDDTVVVLSGDVPLLGKDMVAELVAARAGASMALVTMRATPPKGYGRIVRAHVGLRIVEEKDATPEEREIQEVNAGIYAFQLGFLRREIAKLDTNNAQGELYLTDLAARAGRLPTVEAPFADVAGVNDRVDLARMDAVARLRIAEQWMRSGVTMVAPETISIDADVVAIGRDTTLATGVTLRGKTTVGSGVRVDVGCVVSDSAIGDGAVLKPYTVVTESTVGARAQLGPFAHLRPASVLEDDVHLGNFVETKKTRMRKGAKANHLAYLGDADVGEKVNVGAGVITCNYDGTHKHPTVIEDGAFIGTDSQLVAPVRVGKGAYVAAGTTVTKDVPGGALVLSRPEMVIKEGWVARKKPGKKTP
jgi:bifunctional UDP-N-acetylglucosamine pyrophosphorylase / glucosamine-1-phosphate N-acetyltransferase